MIWRDIQYDWPNAALLLFIILGLAAAYAALFLFRKKKLDAYGEKELLESIQEKRQPFFFWMKTTLCCLTWICGVLALMQPKGNERYIIPSSSEGTQATAASTSALQKVTLRMKMHEVVLLIDASASMSIADAYGGSTREAIAKAIAENIVSQLHGENVSLFAFTSATMQIVPSTTDYLFTRLMIPQLQINEGETSGTDIKQVLEEINKKYFATSSTLPKTVILLTDGGDTYVESLQGQEKEKALQRMLKSIENAGEKNIHVFIVGIGSKAGKEVPGVTFHGSPIISTLDESLLRRMAVVSQGQLFLANELNPMQISQRISKEIAQNQVFEDVNSLLLSQGNESDRLYDLYFQIPLGIAIIALSLFILLPNTFTRLNNISLNT